MILSFIEGTITLKKPAVIKTGNNPFRDVCLAEIPVTEELEQHIPETDLKLSDTEKMQESNIPDKTGNDESTGKETKIFEFTGMEREVLENVTVNLSSNDTATEKSMTVNSEEMEAFRRKYDELMKQLEKERFERELIARSR